MLDDRIERLQQRLEQPMIALVGKQEARRRHSREQIKQLRARGATKVLHKRRNVVNNGQQRRIDGLQPALGCGEHGVNGLRTMSATLAELQTRKSTHTVIR